MDKWMWFSLYFLVHFQFDSTLNTHLKSNSTHDQISYLKISPKNAMGSVIS